MVWIIFSSPSFRHEVTVAVISISYKNTFIYNRSSHEMNLLKFWLRNHDENFIFYARNRLAGKSIKVNDKQGIMGNTWIY